MFEHCFFFKKKLSTYFLFWLQSIKDEGWLKTLAQYHMCQSQIKEGTVQVKVDRWMAHLKTLNWPDS